MIPAICNVQNTLIEDTALNNTSIRASEIKLHTPSPPPPPQKKCQIFYQNLYIYTNNKKEVKFN